LPSASSFLVQRSIFLNGTHIMRHVYIVKPIMKKIKRF